MSSTGRPDQSSRDVFDIVTFKTDRLEHFSHSFTDEHCHRRYITGSHIINFQKLPYISLFPFFHLDFFTKSSELLRPWPARKRKIFERTRASSGLCIKPLLNLSLRFIKLLNRLIKPGINFCRWVFLTPLVSVSYSSNGRTRGLSTLMVVFLLTIRAFVIAQPSYNGM